MDTVKNDSRDRFFHIENQLVFLSAIIAPFLAGIIIAKKGGFTGYFVIFVFSVVLFVASILYSWNVLSILYTNRSNLMEAITTPIRAWRLFLWATFIWSMINGLMKSFVH